MAGGGSSKSKTRDITPQDLVAFRGGLEQIFFDLLGGGFGLSDPSLNRPAAGTAPTAGGGERRTAGGLQFDDVLDAVLGGGGATRGGAADIPVSQGVGGPAFSDVARLLTAGLTGEESAQIDRIRQFGGISETERAAFRSLDETLAGRFLDPNNEVLQGFVEAAQRPIREQNARDQLDQRALFTRAGQNIQSSSPFAAAFSDLQGSLYNSLKDTAAQILYPAFQSERENQLAAANLAPQLLGQIAQRNLQVLEAEGLPRLVAQQGIQNALSELDSRRSAVASALAAAAGLAQPVTGTSSRSRQRSLLGG